MGISDDDIVAYGSGDAPVGGWIRQADCCWGPTSFNGNLSFVVEVGLSESTRQLALAARAWLEPPSSVEVAVTIAIKTAEIIIRRWEIPPREGRVSIRSSYQASCIATFTLTRANNTTSVTGHSHMDGITNITDLNLPFERIVGRSPPTTPGERLCDI